MDPWVDDLSSGSRRRLTFDPASDAFPVWSPDGSRLAFGSARDGSFNLYAKESSGAGSEELLWKSADGKVPTDWSLDGRLLLFQQNDPANKWDLWVLPMDGDRKPRPFLQTPATEFHGQFSPDGRWVAYTSNESGDLQVYVHGFAPGSADKWQISTAGGAGPRWRRDGKELYYLSPAFQVMAVEVKSGRTFEYGPPRVLFQRRRSGLGLGNFGIDYTVTAAGQRFLATTSVEETDTTPITVVVNWPAGLKR